MHVEAARELTRAHERVPCHPMCPPSRLEDAAQALPGLSRAVDLDAEASPLARGSSSSASRCRKAHAGGPDRLRGWAGPPARRRSLSGIGRAREPTRNGGRTVARLRAFRAVDTARPRLAVHLEARRDWQRFEKAHRVGSWLGLTPSVRSPASMTITDRITKTGLASSARPPAGRGWLGTYGREPRVGATLANRQEGQPDHILEISPTAAKRPASSPDVDEGARQAPQRHDCRRRPGAVVLPRGPPRPIQQLHHTDSSTPAQEAGTPGRHSGRHAITLWATPVRVPRSFLDPRTAGSRNRAMGVSESPHFRLANAVTEPTSRPPDTESSRFRDQLLHGEIRALDKRAAQQRA